MSVADIFADAQKSSINHKSLSKRLRKLEAKDTNRRRFEEQVKRCVKRCLEVSKSERAGLNIVKFVCTYCAASQTQEAEHEEEQSNNITNQILILLLSHMSAKDKVIRYRATQIVSQLMGIVQEIEDELYQAVKHELTKRVRDKVPAIRLEAVCALGRLLENEMDEEAQAAQEKSLDDEDEDMLDDDGELESTSLLDRLLDVLQNDTNADVRKALLLNLPIEPKTLPYLLERARDKDASVRRALFAKLMPNLGDFRHLSIPMREKLLRWGLRDRDERVRKATAKMFSTLWIEQIAKTRRQTDAEADEEQLKKKQIGLYEPDMEALAEMLERIDIMNAGQENGIGSEAMNEFWAIREDYFDTVSFDDDFFANLSVETAFMARSFYDYCAQNPAKQLQAAEEQKFPEVTRFGYHLQHYLQNVLDLRNSPEEVDEVVMNESEFIAEQLLHIAHDLDYTDEIGRRKMFSLLRQMMALSNLPEEITKLCIEALRLTCTSDTAGEKEFIAVVQEAIVEVQDELNDENDEPNNDNGTNRETSPEDNDSFVSAHSELSQRSDETARPATTKQSRKLANMTPEQLEEYNLRVALIQLKCLDIAHALLQNITTDFSTNISLDTMLNTLIIPAVRDTDAVLRERAIECLGLACLLSPKLEADNRDLFIYCMRKGHDELRMSCLKILCDCAMVHHECLEARQQAAQPIDLSPYIKAFGYSAEVQSCATTCIAKLMMAGFWRPKIATDEEDEATDEQEVDVFEQAIEEATQGGTKGWELLAKVKAALVADAAAKGALEGERRQS